MKKIVVVDKGEHSLSRIYFIADVRKYQVITLSDFSDAGEILNHQLPDILLVNCDLYKGDFSRFIAKVRGISDKIKIIGFSWRTEEIFRHHGSPLSLDAFIKMPMDVRQLSLALEAIEYNYTLFPMNIFSAS